MNKLFATQEMWWKEYIDADADESIKSLPETNLDVSTTSSSSSLYSSATPSLNDSNKKHATEQQKQTLKKRLSLVCNSTPSIDYAELASAPVETTVTKTIYDRNGVHITHTTVKSTSKIIA